MRMTYRVYREPDGKFLGIVAVKLDIIDTDRRAIEIAVSFWGPGKYRIEVQGIDLHGPRRRPR